MSIYNLNSDKSISPNQNEANTIKTSQSNELDQKQDSVYKSEK